MLVSVRLCRYITAPSTGKKASVDLACRGLGVISHEIRHPCWATEQRIFRTLLSVCGWYCNYDAAHSLFKAVFSPTKFLSPDQRHAKGCAE